jgi:general L-amino acid transport system substrate-binding protein
MIVDAIRSGLIRAEELGVTSSSLEEALAGDEADLRYLLGVEGSIGASLGLTDDFVARAVKHVGNYGEIYARNFADLPRGPNALADDGGQITSRPAG